MTSPEFERLKDGKAICVERTLEKGCYLEKVHSKYYKSIYDIEGNLKSWEEVSEHTCKTIINKMEIDNV